jgi:hypothetical protein
VGDDNPVEVPCLADTVRYHAFLRSGECANVTASGGTWRVRRAFPDAPPAIRASACTYEWVSASPANAAPDVKALDTLDTDHLTEAIKSTTPRCEAPALGNSSVRRVTPKPGAGAPTGVSGCDVCGRMAEQRAFVILPADRRMLRTIVVATGAGSFQSFTVTPPENGQVFSVELPPDAYKQGPFILMEDSF